MRNVGAGLTAGVTLPLVGIGVAALDVFGELEGVRDAFNRLDDADLLKDLRKATKGTVTDLELMKSAVQAKNFKIPLQEMASLLEFARRRAKDTGENVDYLVNSIVTGIGRKSPLILDNLGISASALKDELGGAAVASSSIGDVTKAVGKIARAELQGMGEDALTLKEIYLQFKTTIANSLGDIGGILAESLKPVIEIARDLVARFKDLSPETKKFIVILAGVAAAAGPLLALAGTILPAIGTGLALLTGPIGLVVAGLTAIGVVIYKNWEPIKAQLIEIANYFIDLYNESLVFRLGVEAIKTSFQNLFAIGKFVFSSLGNLMGAVAENIKNAFKDVGKLVKAILTGDVKAIPEILAEGFAKGIGAGSELIKGMGADFETLKSSIEKNITTGVNDALRGKKYALLSDSVDTQALEDKVAAAVGNGLEKGGAGGPFTPQTDKLDIAGQGIVQNPLGSIAENLTDSTKDIKIALSTTRKELTAFQESAVLVGNEVGGAFENMTGRFLDSLGLADDGFQGFIKSFAKTIVKLIAIALSSSIANSIQGATQSGTATGPGAVFATPAFIATAVGGVLAAFAAIPKFAGGGFVPGNSFFGDKQLARVNSGELILNIAQQKNLAGALSGGGGTVILQPSLKYEGTGFRVMLNRVESSEKRRG